MANEFPRHEFSPEDIEAFHAEMKVGLLATVNAEGLPHITLIATLQAASPTTMVWGQFVEGLSKGFIRRNPKVGWLIMTLDKQLWRGQATFTHTAQQGPDYERYNTTPMFRYNAYFGVHTVYYMNLEGHTGRHPLPMAPIIGASVETLLARAFAGRKAKHEALNLWTRQLLSKIGALKFLAYVDASGYPVIVPILQAQTPNSERVLFALHPFGAELRAIPKGTPTAIFGMSLDMETVLARGTFEGATRVGGVPCGSVRVDWVYNSMPPTPEQIYPPVPLEAVKSFQDAS